MTIKLRNIISNLFLLSKLVCDYYVALLHAIIVNLNIIFQNVFGLILFEEYFFVVIYYVI